MQHENASKEQEVLKRRLAESEKALREQERENLSLKQMLQSDVRSQNAEKALTTATNDIKMLKAPSRMPADPNTSSMVW